MTQDLPDIEPGTPAAILDGERPVQYVTNMKTGHAIGFKYFEFKGLNEIRVSVRGNANGRLILSTEYGGAECGEVNFSVDSKEWAVQYANVNIPDGVRALFIKFEGNGSIDMLSLTLN